MEQAKRDAVIELYRAGHSPATITKLLKYHKMTVSRIIKRFEVFGDNKRRPHKTRKDIKRSPEFVAAVERTVKANPGTPIRQLAKRFNVSSSTMGKTIHANLGYKSYVLRVRHLLTERQKLARVTRGTKIINSLKSTGGHLRFFSDEKIFTVDRFINRRNARWICKEPCDVPMVFRSKNPTYVMVLGVVCSNGSVMPPHFFKAGQKVNKEVYLEVLRDVVKPWMDTVANGTLYTFQQDGAPAHKAKVVQQWLKEEVPHFWDAQTWPPSSPDLNPCDFYL